ncbi:insulinase family protein [Bizionia argentinensis JUB59]|uniref:Insulinase family protein n=1 Tax=Bizionia argentinensis JUB59 TaxID=1046627 RepID=G2EHC0_9FLAO|nr:pitrilysin family protein [Bizionia argentinensis]EGV42306.1 insulinase family protein [Bizionia argentinensis JUB59]
MNTYNIKTKLSAFVVLFFIAFSVSAQIDRSKQPKAGPAPKIILEEPGEFQLKNGLKVLVVENHKLPRVSYSLRIDNSPIFEGDIAGVTSVLGAMLGNGTTSIPKDAFNEEIDFLGASLNLGFGSGYASSLSKYSERILELMADAVMNPLLVEEEFEAERNKLIESLKNSDKNPDAIASRVGSALSYGKTHPYGEFTTEETLKNISFNNIKAYYQQYMNPNEAYLVVIGDVDFKTVEKQVKKYFKKWETGASVSSTIPKPAESLPVPQINFIDVPGATQSNISVTNNVSLKMNDPDYFSALIANEILGGGGEGYLFLNLREKNGYTYGSYSNVGANRYGMSRFSTTAKVRNAVTDSSVVETLKEIKRINNEPVDAEVLRNVKAKYTGNFVMALERPQTIASYALNIKLNNLPKDFYETYLQRINDVTIKDVQAAANKFMRPANARIIVVGNGSEVLENLEKVGLPIRYYSKFADLTEKPETSIEMPADMDASKVLNNYINAVGGSDAVNKVKTVYYSAEAEVQPGVVVNLEMKNSTKNQSKQQVSAMGQTQQIQVLNGDAGYSIVQGTRTEMTEEQVKAAQVNSSPIPELNYLNSGVTLEKIEKVDGANAYKIKVDEETSIYYSVETGLKIKETKTSENGQSSTLFGDYKEVKGVKFPFKISQSMGPQSIDLIVKEMKVNEGVSDADFK